MELTTAQQTEAFLFAFLLGLIIGAVYIIYMLFRDIFIKSSPGGFVADIIFMLLASLVNFLFAVAFTLGKIRLYVVAAEAVSFFLLYFTAGRLIRYAFRGSYFFFYRKYHSFVTKISQKVKNSAIFLKISRKDKNQL